MTPYCSALSGRLLSLFVEYWFTSNAQWTHPLVPGGKTMAVFSIPLASLVLELGFMNSEVKI